MTAAPKLEVVADRDYTAEMRELLAAETSGGPYVAAIVAAHVVRKLQATDRDLLHGFLEEQAEYLVRQMIVQRDCASRTRARHNAKPAAFGEDAKRHAAGDRSAMSGWLAAVHVTDDEGTRKRLADLTAADLDYVADRYESRAAENRMAATFIRALRKKVGRKTVKDHFTDEQLSSMWQSLSGPET